MNWDAYIERWSRTSVRLVDIRQLNAAEGMAAGRELFPVSFFVLTTHGIAHVSHFGEVYGLRAHHIVHGGQDNEWRVISASEDFSGYIMLYQAMCDTPEEQASFQLPYELTPYRVLPLLEKCQTMLRLWQQGSALDKLQAQSVFLSFVYESMRQVNSATDSSRMITEAIHYIQEHYKEPITAEELARLYHCSVSYLSRLFKNQIGVGPIEYLIYVRIHKSKQFLLKSEARIKEIAASVGYADVYYFSRLFKKHTGRSPQKFREDNRREVQHNPLHLPKSSIVSPGLLSHNDNESYYQIDRTEGDTTMFRFSRPAIGAMMLLCTSLLLNACQAGQPAGSASAPPASAHSAADTEAAATRSYKHLKGTSDIPVQPQRVVSLFHLGELMTLGVKPVGTTSFVLKNPLLSDVASITDVGVPPDAEKILSLNPDLIVTTAPFAEVVDGGYEALEKIAPTIVLEQYDEPLKDVQMFGDILGKQEEAQQWSETFTEKIAAYKEKIRPYVGADETFTILNVRSGGLFVYGDTNMGGNILYKYLGLKPQQKVADEVIQGDTWEISNEIVNDFIGDRLFLAVNKDAGDNLKEVEKLIQHSSAWKAGKVYTIDFDEFLYSDPISVDKQLDIIADLLVPGGK
ncbi:AraC family transcriptional regulator [Paenibacillus sp. SYP-B4298]|uniref:AraC family transcriptional regulator n=1 Tax=Paenibacillus sp. SYP-B4298 TaxID=2996034 RepID=UPI0022DD0E01|nr:AraC family transcriptional regulator [Paenibacillus sp. SYP-B4298]